MSGILVLFSERDCRPGNSVSTVKSRIGVLFRERSHSPVKSFIGLKSCIWVFPIDNERSHFASFKGERSWTNVSSSFNDRSDLISESGVKSEQDVWQRSKSLSLGQFSTSRFKKCGGISKLLTKEGVCSFFRFSSLREPSLCLASVFVIVMLETDASSLYITLNRSIASSINKLVFVPSYIYVSSCPLRAD